MKGLRIPWIFALALMLATTSALAQKQTERYIPIGKSPGLSGKYTTIGTIESLDPEKGTLTCTGSTGPITVKTDKNTKIWVDRSARREKNLEGKLGDCKKGHPVEVKFRNNDRAAGVAEWVKVAPTEGGK